MAVNETPEYQMLGYVQHRVRVAVWGVAIAIALLASTTLTWVRHRDDDPHLEVGQTLGHWSLWDLAGSTASGGESPGDTEQAWGWWVAALVVVTLVLLVVAAAEGRMVWAVTTGAAAILTFGLEIGLRVATQGDRYGEFGEHAKIYTTKSGLTMAMWATAALALGALAAASGGWKYRDVKIPTDDAGTGVVDHMRSSADLGVSRVYRWR
jgi:hypothetical protein